MSISRAKGLIHSVQGMAGHSCPERIVVVIFLRTSFQNWQYSFADEPFSHRCATFNFKCEEPI